MDIQPSQGALFMKIGRINRLTKAGELVSVRLPNGKTISAKAGNDLTSTTVLVSKTQSGWFAFSSQGETKTTSTQIVNRRPRRVTPNIYPIKVLFSIEIDDRIEFYIGGDRSIPVKIWELEREDNRTEIRKAVINSTGNKPNDWVVSIQYYRYFDTIEIPEAYQGLPPNSTIIQGVESSAIITNNNTTIHVGTNEINPIGNSWFAPDAVNWFKTDPDNTLPSSRGYFGGGTQIELFNQLLVGEDAITDYLALETDPVELYDISDTSYTTQIGSLAGFEYLSEIDDFGGGTRYIFSNLWTPTNEYILSDFLDWDTTKAYSEAQITGLSNDLAGNFYAKAYTQSMVLNDMDLIESHAYTQPNNNFLYYDTDYLRSLNNNNPEIALGDLNINSASVRVTSQDNSLFNNRYPSIQKQGSVGISGQVYSNGGSYSFGLGSYDSDGVFNFPLIDDTGFSVQTVSYSKAETDYSWTLRRGNLLKFYFFDVIKSRADGAIEILGESINISLDFIEQEEREDAAYNELRRKKVGAGESLLQKGLDATGIGHKIEYSWEEYREGFSPFDYSFPVTPAYTETAFYYDGTGKYPLETSNSDFRRGTFFVVSIQDDNAYRGLRIAPNYKGEDILENNKISRVAWAEEDGEALKESDVKLDVKTYRIIVDGGTATIPNSSKIKTFKAKKISRALEGLSPEVIDTLTVHSMSCYFN
jgi:hypothetical protein